MGKPWQLADWEKRRKEYIKGKVCEWCGSIDHLTIHHPQPRNSLSDEEYSSFEGTIILCRRCHWAEHKGMHLCPQCKKKYVPWKYTVCFDCLPEKIKKEIKEFREWSNEEDNWHMRVEYCGNCDSHIEKNQELFCSLPSDKLCDHGLYEEDGIRRRIRI